LDPLTDSPTDGDVLITSERGLHFLSVVPHPHRLSFHDLGDAIAMARRWSAAQSAEIWRVAQGITVKVPREGSRASKEA
jgi:hypothetical protein